MKRNKEYKSQRAKESAALRSAKSKAKNLKRKDKELKTYPKYSFIGPLLHPDSCPF